MEMKIGNEKYLKQKILVWFILFLNISYIIIGLNALSIFIKSNNVFMIIFTLVIDFIGLGFCVLIEYNHMIKNEII